MDEKLEVSLGDTDTDAERVRAHSHEFGAERQRDVEERGSETNIENAETYA
ncbi:hypothetical protein HSB1_22310 [Halogranum salarium B-1]|uniref:Uncharacterized protein n=1 Tax=Halogranum salarium B-1 TaxID=1210908 RepID=J3EWT1_9EURY|nr:hypothetical protein HSB1_22310 [Halogranum salarium B-1]